MLKQHCSALSFLFSLSQLRRVPTLSPGQSLVSQHKRPINQTASTKLFQLPMRKWSATKFISAKSFFSSEKGPHRTSTCPSSQQHNCSVFPYCRPSWGEAEVAVWSVYQLAKLPERTLVCTMEGLCVRISWIRLKILKFTGTILQEREKTKNYRQV